ncbi:pro-neuregulin-2, membrane-bound isoform isoform X2 [Parasteatoda tepidariorum]|uniref:pro-neuregulin-2, membrane-bound isoform isoform X2 n=1 Tax=Parasteatoda tepidariorum TaxID=114398 RepID=UPI001C72310C|nr:pro-neuregulin-2, membrane-bound isoform isoform X2 [Parasteatoda tepidariorum]
MRLPYIYQILRHLLLVFLCLSSLWLVTPCLDISTNNTSELCLDGKKQSKQRRHNDNFSMKALMDAAQTRAYLSPAVFLGTLRSVLVQRDGTIRAWFAMDNALKTNTSKGGTSSKEDTEVVYYRSGNELCLLEVNQNNLKLGSQYLVFGVPSAKYAWPSVTATALPIPNDKRILRAVKKVICKDCAKAPSISGLQNVREQEGTKIQLHCHLEGNPIPWVEWYKNGVEIERRGRIRVKTKRRTSRLTIRKARTSDRGTYECRAGNVVSEDSISASTTVVVTRKKTTKTTTKKPTTTTSTTTVQPTTTQSSPWTTEPCPTSDFCLNGGTCVFYRVVREYVCHCADGFVGLRCDYKDVSISVGEVRNMDQSYDRLFIAILVLFLIFFCSNWACVGICWLCCLRCQRKDNNWGKFRDLTLLQKFLKSKNWSDDDKVSDNVDVELSESKNGRSDDKFRTKTTDQ